MNYRTLPNGSALPMLGLGTWKSDPGDVYRAVKTAIDIGYRHIDCAFIYGNEKEVGAAIAESIEQGVVCREDLWITSKLWNDSHAPADVAPALEKTLADLQLSYLDLYLIHWPVVLKKGLYRPADGSDMIPLEELPIAHTWEALEALVERGLTRSLGVSNFSKKKIQELIENARIQPSMNQIELHPYLQQTELVEFCHSHQIEVTAYSPLGSPDRPAGLKQADEPSLLDAEVVNDIAQSHQITPAQVLIAWALQRGTIVIPKSVNQKRLAENFEAHAITLKEESFLQIASLDKHRRYLHGEFWTLPGSGYTLENLWDEQAM